MTMSEQSNAPASNTPIWDALMAERAQSRSSDTKGAQKRTETPKPRPPRKRSPARNAQQV